MPELPRMACPRDDRRRHYWQLLSTDGPLRHGPHEAPSPGRFIGPPLRDEALMAPCRQLARAPAGGSARSASLPRAPGRPRDDGASDLRERHRAYDAAVDRAWGVALTLVVPVFVPTAIARLLVRRLTVPEQRPVDPLAC
jgi:hypothetical protein